jgi:hypothetical protein
MRTEDLRRSVSPKPIRSSIGRYDYVERKVTSKASYCWSQKQFSKGTIGEQYREFLALGDNVVSVADPIIVVLADSIAGALISTNFGEVRRMLPFLLRLARAFCGGFQHRPEPPDYSGSAIRQRFSSVDAAYRLPRHLSGCFFLFGTRAASG